MFCSSCGSAIPQNLTYCSRCGVKVPAKVESLTTPGNFSPQSLVWAMVSLFVAGTGVIIGLMAVMKIGVELNVGIILLITMLCFTLMALLEGVFVWLLLSAKRNTRVHPTEQLPENSTKELTEAQPRALSEPVSSVTDHTTRAFEPVYIDQKLK